MSNLMDSEEEGVTVFWRMVNLSKTLSAFRAEFRWPQTGSLWQLYLEPEEMAAVILYKDGDPVRLRVTYSIVTNENIFYKVGQLTDCNFTKETVKGIQMKTLQINDSDRDIFLPNDTLTLRIHMWDLVNNMTAPVQYYIRSSDAEQKVSFQWIIKSENDSSGNPVFSKCETVVPGDFSDFISSQTFQLKMTLLLENFGEVVVENSLKSGVQFNLTYKLNIQYSESKSIVLFSEGEHIPFYTFNQSRRRPLSINLTEFKSRKDIYYPKGYLTLLCDVVVLSPSYVMQNVQYGSKSTFCWNDDSDSCNSVAIMSDTPAVENMTLRDCLYSMYKDGELCDVTLRTGDSTYPCHKTVLCARSPVFRALFKNDMKEKSTNVVDITDIDSRTLGIFLTALYIDTLGDIDWDLALSLYAVSDKYSVLPIRKKCSVFIVARLSTSNICEVLVLADKHQDQGLGKTAKSFFCKHASQMIHSEEWVSFMTQHIQLAAEMMRISFPK